MRYGSSEGHTIRRARLAGIAALFLFAIAAGFGAAWWWLRAPGTPPRLTPHWPATVSVLAGNGRLGSVDGPSARAQFVDPYGLVLAPDGTVIVADHDRLRAIDSAGNVRSFARGLASPSAIARADDGTLYVADTGNDRIVRVSPDGAVSPLPLAEPLSGPMGVALLADGALVVADTYHDRVLLVRGGTITAITGPPDFPFDTPTAVAAARDGAIYVADAGHGLVRVIDASGAVTTAGDAVPGTAGRPVSLAAGHDGTVFVADERGRVLEVTRSGAARVVAGSTPGYANGAGAEARFRRLGGVAVLGEGRLVVSDPGNALVRLVTATARREWGPPDPPLIAPAFDAEAFGRVPLLWPVAPMEGPFEVAGTMGEARGSEGNERFHAGVDVRVDAGTPVRAVRDGTIVHAIAAEGFNTLDERLRIGPLAYIHIRAGRDGRNAVVDTTRFVPTFDERGRVVRVRAKRGARFETGDIVGSVNRFNHVHLNVGWPGEEHNPLHFELVQFHDTLPPTIARGGIRLHDERWQPLSKRERGRVLVSGRVRIVVDAWDQADGNTASRRLGLYALGYDVLTPDGQLAVGHEPSGASIRFDRLTPGGDAPRMVYAPGSGIPFYGQRRTRFLYTVTNRFIDGIAEEGFWDSSLLPPGPYTLRVWARDFAGNTATANHDLPVVVVAASTEDTEDTKGTKGTKDTKGPAADAKQRGDLRPHRRPPRRRIRPASRPSCPSCSSCPSCPQVG